MSYLFYICELADGQDYILSEETLKPTCIVSEEDAVRKEHALTVLYDDFMNKYEGKHLQFDPREHIWNCAAAFYPYFDEDK